MKTGWFLLSVFALCAAVCGPASAFAQPKSTAAPTQTATALVPFVGCPSDGQQGPVKAPNGKAQTFPIAVQDVQRLAYYKAEYTDGVLAPRGWHCFSTYGSSGSNLYVSADPIDGKTLMLSSEWKGFSGPVVQLSVADGDTSGRFEVARVIARVFPEYRTFADDVIAEGLEPTSDFPFGPFPGDKLVYRSKNVVEFETPANTTGLGTSSRLRANADPIEGVAILTGEETNLIQLSARLSPPDRFLIPLIVKQVEQEAQVNAE